MLRHRIQRARTRLEDAAYASPEWAAAAAGVEDLEAEIRHLRFRDTGREVGSRYPRLGRPASTAQPR
jgi:hypothetical protein